MSTLTLTDIDQIERELPLSGAALTDLAQGVLAKDRLFRFRAQGTSMYPFVRDGDVIVISPLRVQAPRVGDIVACLRLDTNRFFVHRILRKQANCYLIKGDNACCDDGWFPRESILGRVVQIERRGSQVRFGLGVERLLIVTLARLHWLVPVVNCGVWRFALPLARRIRS